MTVEEFSGLQLEDGRRALSSLLQDCIRRFLAAGSLVGLDGPVFKSLGDARYAGNVDLTALFPAWEVICERYRRERFDQQPSLFKDHRVESLERWGQFLHWELFPHLLRENEFVRNVLRATGLLPCRSQQQATSALCGHIREMSLPFGRPPWDPAEIE
jgi:hypothetical protein